MAVRNRKEIVTLAVVFAGVLVVSALAVYLIGGTRQFTPTTQSPPTPEASRDTTDRRAGTTPTSSDDQNFADRLFGSAPSDSDINGRRWGETILTIASRLLLATLLGAALAFRPRRPIFGLKRNPFVSQTQILLAIVAAALMIIVGDNAARAFGIFAAVSLVRFRTNIRDPKEITVLLISLALGLASGVGRWDLALMLAIFALLVLWILEWREPKVVFRAMQLKVLTRDIITTQQALGQIFAKHGFDCELRTIDRGAREEDAGQLVYSVDISPVVSTDQLSDEIFELDERHVQSIDWDQKKNYSYLYQ